MGKNCLKPSILIVDSDVDNIKKLRDTLQADYRIQLAADISTMIAAASSQNPSNLILLNTSLSGEDGFEICSMLKEVEQTKNIPIIFLATTNSEQEETKSFERGGVDYIPKPFRLQAVKARLKMHLDLKRSRDNLENLSMIDALTGIANRRRFNEYYLAEWKRSIREATQLSLIMIDIDFFKLYNDNHGHGAGDECLRRVAKGLHDIVRRPADLLVRFGGEEFACILPKTNLQGTVRIAELMRKNIETLKIPHGHSAISDYITVSLGTATHLPNEHSRSDTLIDEADKCLYQAKENGRNQLRSIDLNEIQRPSRRNRRG